MVISINARTFHPCPSTILSPQYFFMYLFDNLSMKSKICNVQVLESYDQHLTMHMKI